MKGVQCIEFNGSGLTIYERGVPGPNASEVEKAGKHHAFAFDYTYPASVPQEQVFIDVGQPVLTASFRGYNTCIFAYGQTGSGKSYAMMGPSGGRDASKDPGIIPRLCTTLFATLKSKIDENSAAIEEKLATGAAPHEAPPKLDIIVEVSYLEIYQEKIKCLLSPSKDNLKVRQHPALGVYVESLTEVAVGSYDKVFELIDGGNNSRAIAATNMNERSSRSHAIFTINLSQKRTSKTKEGLETATELKARINLVDLAGSERAKSTGAEGDTLREGANINKSLTVLGLVISGLAELSKYNASGAVGGKQPFIPYRDSMLTYLLKESLGGNSKTFMLSTISPAHVNYEETLSTLRYADRAKSIVTKACINESAGDKKIRELEDEVSKLRAAIMEFQEKAKKTEEVAKVVPKLNLSGLGGPSAPTRGKMPVMPAIGRGGGAGGLSLGQRRTGAIGVMTPRSAINRVLTRDDVGDDEDAINTDDGSEVDVDGEGDISEMEARLERDMSLILAEKESKEQKELRAQQVLHELADAKTVKVARSDPYLMNIDNAGDWLVEYLVDEVTYLGTEKIDEPVLNARCVIVGGDDTDGVGPQHCCLVRLFNGGFALRPLEGCSTFLNDDENPIEGDVTLSNGSRICIGDNFLQFKYVDPNSQAPTTGRRRPTIRSSPSVAAPQSPSKPRLSGSRAQYVDPTPSTDDSPSTLSPAIPSTPTSESASSGKRPPVVPMLKISARPVVPSLNLPGTRSGSATNTAPPGDDDADVDRDQRSPSPVSPPPPLPAPIAAPATPKHSVASSIGQSQARGSVTLMNARPATASTPRMYTGSGAGGGILLQSGVPREDMTAVYRHVFVFLGRTRSGKTTLRQSLASAHEKWYSGFFKRTLPPTAPTFGFDLNKIETGTIQRTDLTLIEIAGYDSFSVLQSLVPDKRVTFTLCVSLVEELPTLETLRDYLEFVVSHSASSETTLVLFATHLEDSKMTNASVIELLTDLDEQISSFMAILQPMVERRPRLVAKFAVGCRERTVLSPSSRISKVSELLQWMADHALHRCKTDSEFPNCLVPHRVLKVQEKLRELRAQGRWCLPGSEYKTILKQIDARYERLDDMQRHTQLLHSWVELHHHYRHMHLKKTIILDVPWVMQLISAVCCCVAAPDPDQGGRGSGGGRGGEVGGGAAADGSLVPLITTRFALEAKVPFRLQSLQQIDPFGLCTKGILTVAIASELFRDILKQKNFTLRNVEGMLELLETYDLLMRGSHLKFSSFHSTSLRDRASSQIGNLSNNSLAGLGEGNSSPHLISDDALDRSGGGRRNSTSATAAAADGGDEIVESFYLIPSCFQAAFPSSLALHLAPLLFCPTHRFSLNMIPTQFFSRFVSRVSRYAQKLYLGPAIHSPTHHVENSQLWKGAVWVVSSSTSRALVRMVGHSLFITFHDHSEDSDFYEGLRHVVQCLVSESPGAHCTETILCRSAADAIDAINESHFDEDADGGNDSDDGMDDEAPNSPFGAMFDDSKTFWIPLDENLNSLEKIREREQGALKSARGTGRRDAELSALSSSSKFGGGETEDAVPVTCSRTSRISHRALMRRISRDILMLDDVASRMEKAIHLVHRGRQLPDRERGAVLEGRGMDALVDALAQA